ncbi:MAG: lipid-A-disaccharide synthase N-terminal domain-containing protein [Planctomycetes bacterium]|nr:lipid-A-disaccharide synthase N-terminal domain-containing protein [Planctomycetota bacterium]
MFTSVDWRWEVFGLAGEGLFFARLIAQWLASEKAGRPVIPRVYWYMSLVGAVIVLAYAVHKDSLVLLLPQLLGIFFYGRGLQLENRARRQAARRVALGLDRPDYPWPRLSVVVPVHNEERQLPATLENLTSLSYPGPTPEIIVALNGCSDGSRQVAEQFPVTIREDSRSGMSYGKNLGAAGADCDMLVFVDADTRLPENALRLLAEAAAGHRRYMGTVAGAPDRGGGVVRVCFFLANRATRRSQTHAPGGVMLMDRHTYEAIGGFDEALPQGTSTDCIRRGLAAGADYLFVDTFRATTSIRRFEKTGIIRQMLDWRRNHRALRDNRREEVAGKAYEDVR